MKGITHFLNGVAAATFFPAAVQASLNDKSWIFMLSGAMGILADTLDFRVSRYIYKHDYEVNINDNNLDPQVVAETVAKAINEAWQTKKTVKVRLNTIKVSANYYRTYSIKFDNETKEVVAQIGQLKSLGQVMGAGGGMPGTESDKTFRAKYEPEIKDVYEKETQVGIFSGPDFAFVPVEDGVKADFIPWHRTWAHSLTLSLITGLVGFLLFLNWNALWNPGEKLVTSFTMLAFWIGIVSFLAHIANDQLGHMGNQLFYPVGGRLKGLGLTSSAAAVGNIICNYLSFAVILFNLNAFSGSPVFRVPFTSGLTGDFSNLSYYLASFLIYFILFILLPSFAFWGVVKLYQMWTAPLEEEKEDESSAEGEDKVGELSTE